MRILIVVPEYPSVENEYVYTFVHTRAKVYAQTGNDVKVFVPSAGQIPLAYVYDGIRVVRTGWMYFVKLIADFDPDILAVHAPRGQWGTRISKAKRPIVSWIHGAEALIQAFHHYYIPFSLKDSILKAHSLVTDPVKCFMLGRFLRMSEAVVYPSQWMKNVAERYTSVRHPMTFVIPNPINTDLFNYSNFDKKLEQNKGVSVRALDWKYGLDVAVRAYSNMKETSLMILGKGPLERYLKKLAKLHRSNVEFITKRVPNRELPNIYNKFGYFVAPSRTEGQGVAMCEAMGCGLPAIATNVGGIPEFVTDKFNGLLVPSEDALKLGEAIRMLVSNPRLYELLSDNAANFVKSELSHVKIYKKEREMLTQAQETHGKRK